MGVDNNLHVCYNELTIKREELINMNDKLYVLLSNYINEELSELDLHANVDDMDGIIENVIYDIDERIIEYRDTVRED